MKNTTTKEKLDLAMVATLGAAGLIELAEQLWTAATQEKMTLEQTIQLNITAGTLAHAKEFLLKLANAMTPPDDTKTPTRQGFN